MANPSAKKVAGASAKGGAGAPAAKENKPNADNKSPDKKSDTNIIQVPALSVVSSREGFRRGGRAWGKETTVVKLSDLTDEQIGQIKGEALLTVTEVEIDEEVSAE